MKINGISTFISVIGVKDKALLKKFGNHLRVVRKSNGFSQSNLANTAEVSLSQISRIERGEINPTLCTLNALAKAMKISISELLDIDYSETKSKK